MVTCSTPDVQPNADWIALGFGVLLLGVSLIGVRQPTIQLYFSAAEIALCIVLCLFGLIRLTAWKRVATIVLAAATATMAILQSADIWAAGAFSVYPRLCPACHVGIVVSPELVAARAAAEPSKNLAIWNGSYHGPDYENYSKICTLCWMAYHDYRRRWERASEVPDAFYRPLRPSIRQVPLPAAEHVHNRVVYTQYWSPGQIRETVGFWCDDLPEVIEPLRAYAAAHNLFFGIDEPSRPSRPKGQQFVLIETDPPTI